jgi:hypothetical protein
MLEDFDTFFEKLNKLDAPEVRKVDSLSPRQPNPTAGPKVSPSLARKPAVTSSAPLNADPLAGLRAAFAQARKAQAAEIAHKPSRPRGKLASLLRFALTALVLFAGGMGIGWAALSLPGKFTETAAPGSGPAKGLIVEQKADALLAKPSEDKSAHHVVVDPLVEAAQGPLAKTESLAKPGQGTTLPETVASATLPVDVAAKQTAAKSDPGAGEKKSDAAQEVAAQAEPAVAADSARAGDPVAANSEEKPHIKPARAHRLAPAQPATESDSIPAASDVSSASTGEAHFAVQVGACRSTRCVENYRRLISAHLASPADQIHIVAVPSQGSETGVQRVRVAPLDKVHAQKLRAALIQADPRLSEAYVVEFHP